MDDRHTSPAGDPAASAHPEGAVPAELPAPADPPPPPPCRKVLLVGRIEGVDACSLHTPLKRIVVGSAADCDLVLSDPLAPPYAFVLQHLKEHTDHEDCGSCWEIIVAPEARVFVNRDLAHRERINFGDTISVGCHLIFFLSGVSTERSRRAYVDVDDLCARLAAAVPVPTGFLHTCASWRDRMRGRRVARWGAGLAGLLLLLLLLTPRLEKTEIVPESLDVVIVPEENPLPSREMVRSLEKVERKAIEVPLDPTNPTELVAGPEAAPLETETAPILSKVDTSPAPAPALDERLVADAGSLQPAKSMTLPHQLPVEIERTSQPLAKISATERQSRLETLPESTPREIGLREAQIDQRDTQAVALNINPEAARPTVPDQITGDAGTLQAAPALELKNPQQLELVRAARPLEKGTAAARQTHVESVPQSTPRDIAVVDAKLKNLESQMVQQTALNAAPAAPTLPTRGSVNDAGTLASNTRVLAKSAPAANVSRGPRQLQRGAAAQRQNRAEKVELSDARSMQALQAKIEARAAQTMVTAATRDAVTTVAPTRNIETNRAEVVGALPQFKPSPVQFEEYRGHRIPVARMAESLSQMTISDGNKAHILDGTVSAAEVALSWKSGRFRVHGPGQPPPAEPPTECFVGKTKVDGRDFLYISFICTDPNVDQLVLTHPNGGLGVERDDSIEIFLDMKSTRYSYNHLIINARGAMYSAYCPDPTKGINGLGTPVDLGTQVKTAISRESRQWTCEVLIPFDRIGGVPPKGTRWPVNFSRNFRGQAHPSQVLSSWFLVYEGAATNYHHPRLFGVFEW